MARLLLLVCLNLTLTLHGGALAGTDSIVSDDLPGASLENASQESGLGNSLEEEAMSLRVVATRVVGQITGTDSPNDTATRWDVRGTDLGHMFWHRDKLHMVFGDTFGATGASGRNWRSNVMARIADPDPRNGFPFEAMITGPDGLAKELIPSRKIDGEEMTVIPTHGISVNDRMYLHYMSVRHWEETGGVWTVGHSGLAYSDDDGQTWETPAEAIWPRASGFEQVAFVVDEGVLYTLGIPEGRFGGVRLSRVAPDRILVRDAYDYWDGGQWVAAQASAATIVPAPVGELSVAWSEPHRRWLMMYLDPERHVVMLRSASRLTGPWSEAQVVVTADEYPGLYAPYIVPGTDLDTDLYYTMSQWGPYNVFLMRTTLERTAPDILSAGDGPMTQGGATATVIGDPE